MFETFFLMLCGHAIADYPLQSDFIAKYKNAWATWYTHERWWPWILSAHALVHGYAVYLATGNNTTLGVLETLCHWIIDLVKCAGWTGFHTDQILHVACKVLWLILLANGAV